MAKRKPHDLVPVTRNVLEAVAEIIGPASAAARMLEAADEYGGPVRFWNDRAHHCFVMERLGSPSPREGEDK